MKISIIIPSRERARYLGASIQTVLDIDDPNIELIVADNASVDGTDQVVAGFDDPRLIYLPSNARVSMRENFNRSVLASTGDYVIVFGDDDAILPRQFPYLRRLLEEHRPDGVSWFKATYGWPIEGFGDKTGGIRFYRDDCFGAPQPYDPKDYLNNLLRCELAQLNPTPNTYHGCVSRAYFEAHKPSDGVLFDSTIPDVNFQYRSIYNGGHFLHLRHPFTINGYSPASTGTAHSNPKEGSEGDKIGKSFAAENKADPYDDIIDHALTIQLVFFSTLETLRTRGGYDTPAPDYARWYNYALNAARSKPAEAERIDKILADYADQTGTQAQLLTARAMPVRSKRTLAERWARVQSQFQSFRLSAEMDGVNTVHSATRVMDAVLSDDYGTILDGGETKNGAWAKAKRRSKNFKRQL
ncbi:glycosyltransferase family 2 protein [Falsiruegeria mediterranea]|jgi:glycosyltransferase involved in cell wall biosynthesis|uniref:Glycosyltransferase EpsE n=1 Tax=Falsiruegeria mediterranea M17 TaxID=1200281 RepID=A0A2R8CBM1_9RHOB|nr:glycosyltransferase family 2 protein [Falsiruegeria mediterranea]SPJ29778.1 Putative glycosyltransferase EpsE [Falsiruegeria mediterranea M17]